MWFSEVIALAIVATAGSACFLATLWSLVSLVNKAISAGVRWLEHDIEIRRFEAQTRIEAARLNASIPAWIDRSDPQELAAWNRAVAETWRVTAKGALEASRH